MPLRICFLAEGQSVHALKWMRYFAARDHDVHLATFGKTGPIEGVNVHNMRYFSKIAYPFRILEARKTVKEIEPDILHAHYVSNYGMYAALTGFKPLVLTAWGSDVLIEPQESMIKKHIVTYALRKSDLVTCDAEHVKAALRTLGAAPEKIQLINFGVDTQKFSPTKKSQRILAKLGINDSPSVISLRNLDPLYDVETLIRSIPFVRKEIPESKFLIAGKGSEEMRLKDLAVSLGVSKSTRFLGFVPNDELPEYLNSVDVYVSTSPSDAGLSASTAEAMACGIPVIVTDVADNRKWVEDGINGFVVPTTDPKSLAEKIIYLLNSQDVRKRLGKIGRKIIQERNDYYQVMKKMEGIYEELAEEYS
jgi:glycosyltransferase involved in cell wall biosynthesis